MLQRSVLGAILFTIYLNNFAGDKTPCVFDKNLAFALGKSEEHSNITIKWFKNN